MREFISLLPGLLALAACTPLEPHEQRIVEACGTLERHFEATRQDALMGNQNSIDCEIAVADGSYSMRELDPPEAVDSVRWRYLRWIVTGEEPDDLMDLTAYLDQQYLEANLSLIFTHHLEATGQLYAGRYDAAGCFLRPPRMDQLYQRAQPHPDMAACEAAVRDHPFG
jgi:hypothetical protein